MGLPWNLTNASIPETGVNGRETNICPCIQEWTRWAVWNVIKISVASNVLLGKWERVKNLSRANGCHACYDWIETLLLPYEGIKSLRITRLFFCPALGLPGRVQQCRIVWALTRVVSGSLKNMMSHSSMTCLGRWVRPVMRETDFRDINKRTSFIVFVFCSFAWTQVEEYGHRHVIYTFRDICNL